MYEILLVEKRRGLTVFTDSVMIIDINKSGVVVTDIFKRKRREKKMLKDVINCYKKMLRLSLQLSL